jgi:asparagine synthase (glutamine-hydrolysing)
MLFKVDRTSMANSLEVRSPYLDYRLIEYVLGSNLNFINHEEPKKIMKNYLSNNFDDKFLNRNKQGFVFNVENWVYNNMNYLDSELKDSIVTLEYNKNILKSLSLNKTRINGIRIWKLFVLSQYMKRL